MSVKKNFEFKTRLPTFDSGSLENVSRIIGDTSSGFTGQEIGRFLADCSLSGPDPTMTKWKSIYNSLVMFQNEHKVGNHVVQLINHVMQPSFHLRNESRFNLMKDSLNVALSMSGYRVDDSGKVKKASVANTVSDAKSRSINLKKKLQDRKAHEEVFHFCDEQLLQDNYFHATLETVKSITSRVRKISSLSGDGASLIDNAFLSIKGAEPIIKINTYDTETKKVNKMDSLIF